MVLYMYMPWLGQITLSLPDPGHVISRIGKRSVVDVLSAQPALALTVPASRRRQGANPVALSCLSLKLMALERLLIS